MGCFFDFFGKAEGKVGCFVCGLVGLLVWEDAPPKDTLTR